MNKVKQGYIPVMLTPFTDSGEVDYNGLTELTDLYLNAGVTGLFANCLSSEMYELTERERLQVTQHVVNQVNGRVPVVAAGTFNGTIREQSEFIKKINDTGVQSVIVITGIMAAETEPDAILDDRIFRLLDETGSIKLGLYECPVPYKRIISAAQLKKYVATGRVTYLKDTSLDIDQVRAKLAAVKGFDFGLYDAYMAHAVESLKAGSHGLSCIQGNFFPELVIWLCENYNNASLKNQVDKVQELFSDNMDVVHHVYPVIAKYFLQKRGLNISAFTRREVGMFTVDVKSKVDKLYDDFAYIQKELNIEVTGYPF